MAVARESDEPEVSDVEALVGELRVLTRRLDPRYLTGSEAARLVELYAEGERLCAAGRTLAG